MRLLKVTSILLLPIIMSSLCSCNKEHIIPKKKLAKIYADMFLMDQWIETNPTARRKADTMAVYGTVLENYGYDEDDYRASISHYMDDPERFSKILRKSASILEARLEGLEAQKKENKVRDKVIIKFDFNRIMVPDSCGFYRMADRDSMEYFSDSVKFNVLDPFYFDVRQKTRIENSPEVKEEIKKIEKVEEIQKLQKIENVR